MGINVGERFDNFVITNETRKMISRWSAYRNCCRIASEADGFEKNILESCLEDEYSEIKNDQQLMGVGLWAYNQAYRRA